MNNDDVKDNIPVGALYYQQLANAITQEELATMYMDLLSEHMRLMSVIRTDEEIRKKIIVGLRDTTKG